jgi:hypothetical protein
MAAGTVPRWTAGASRASSVDLALAILIEGDGKSVRGKPTIDLNKAPRKPGYVP